MERQIFINEMQARFNLRKPRSEKPTNLYLVCRINNKQVKLSTGVKIYPDHWNEKRQEAYISVRLSEIDNINNTIVNKKITKLKEYLKQNNIEYVEYNISKSSEHKRNLIKEGFLSVPVMKIDSDYVLGFDVPRINQLLNL